MCYTMSHEKFKTFSMPTDAKVWTVGTDLLRICDGSCKNKRGDNMDSDTMQVVYDTINNVRNSIQKSAPSVSPEEIQGALGALYALEADLKILEDESKQFPPKE